VHRLDTDTSGVIVFALTRLAQGHLGKQFEHRQTQKAYVARVWGDVMGDEGRVDLPLIVDWPNRPRQHVNHATGRPAQTDWRVLSRGDQETRMELRPLTGRSHQLRVHMAALGHPILGDPLYASGAAANFPRLMLHAQMIRFRHPEGGAPVRFESPVPF
jgi:tRNA pseudouridine32 synthase / 23S rRNA pseudouridine746 synthase